MLLPQFDSSFRHALDILIRPVTNSLVLTEFPKSGGTWIGSLLSDALDIPYVRHSMPPLSTYVIHKHVLPGILAGSKPIIVVRDGRDIMVSYFFHAYYLDSPHTKRLTEKFASVLPTEDRESDAKNLCHFIEKSFTSPVYPRFSWKMFCEQWLGVPDALIVKYESFNKDPAAALESLLHRLGQSPDMKLTEIVDKHSFQNVSGRSAGTENKSSFLRKGIIGDWRNHFSREAAEIFEYHAGSILRELNYEQDESWVKELDFGNT